MITMYDLSKIIYSDYDAKRLSTQARDFVEEARKDKQHLFIFQNLPKELYDIEISMREIQPKDLRYGNEKRTKKFEDNMNYLNEKTIDCLSRFLPENIIIVPLRHGKNNYDIINLTKSSKEIPDILNLSFYRSGPLQLEQFLTAEIYKPTFKNINRTNKVSCIIKEDIRDYRKELIESKAHTFAHLIKKDIEELIN